MKPTPTTIFLPITDLVNYSNKDIYYCFAVVFSPETENQHFYKCPPYIGIGMANGDEQEFFFEVPEIVAYYAKTHPVYTMKGRENNIAEGRRSMAKEIRNLLEID